MDLDPDDPIPLEAAAKLFFPAGGVTISTLRTEIRKGRLVPERIGGKDYVTKSAIEEMRRLCRLAPKVQDCGSGDDQAGNRNGSSSIEDGRSQLASAKATASKLKRRSPTTSPTSTKRRKAQVIQLR